MWSAIALAFGLAMDATAVSAARGLAPHPPREAAVLPLLFGGFQAGMAALGWLAGAWLGPYIAAWDHWVAFALLVAIGGKMIVDAWRGPGEAPPVTATAALYLGLALATSIDAAAAGLTLPLVPVAPSIALVLIGAVTTACAASAYQLARVIGSRFGPRLAMLGGLVLIAIAVQLLVHGLADAPAPPTPSPAPRPTAGHVRLPRSAATPPRPTTQPLSGDQLARLAAIEHVDFAREERGKADGAIEFRHTTRARPTLGVTVQIARCEPATCPAMTLDAWAGRRAELARALPAALVGHADTQLALGTRVLPGAVAISTYQLGASFASDALGQPAGAYVNTYSLDYNDRINRIRVTASYLDDAVGGVDRLLAIAPPEDLEKLAVAFLSFYLHQWQ